MDKKTVLLLAEYHRAANEKMDAVIKTLTKEEWDKNLSGFFSSIHSLCSHMYISDYILLKQRYMKTRDFITAKDSFFTPDYTFKDVIFPAKEEYLALRPELDKRIISFCKELNDNDFAAVMKFTDSRGNHKEKELAGSILHGFNHATHHRGMVSVYLEILGKPNDYSAILPYVEKKD